MIGENINNLRKEKGISQEEMAEKLNVVRQTVSKWEKDLSVPDADMLLKIADLLEVSVNCILGSDLRCDDIQSMTEELSRLNSELETMRQKEKTAESVSKKRGMILFTSFVSMFIALTSKNEIISIAAFGACAVITLVILYRNAELMTNNAEHEKIRSVRTASVFNFAVIAAALITVLLKQARLIELSKREISFSH